MQPAAGKKTNKQVANFLNKTLILCRKTYVCVMNV